MDKITFKPIGIVKSPRKTPEDDDWGTITSIIELDPAQFTDEAVAGLSDFSHLDVIFHMHLVSPDQAHKSSRHPRNRTDWPKVGIFAQRAKARPNPIGVTTCRLIRVDGLTITVQGLDAINGTPVLDIKPYMKEFGVRETTSQPSWVSELMKNYF